MTGHGQPDDTFVVETQQHRDRGYTALRCDTCDATWVGPDGEPCTYCQISLEKMRTWQAELVLTAPNVDRDDRRRDDVLRAWADRLAVAVQAGLIGPQEAHHAMKRATADV